MNLSVILLSLFAFLCACVCEGSKILVIFPSSSKSHVILGQALAKGLLKNGHHVTMITPFSLNTKNGNYTEIFIDDLKTKVGEAVFGIKNAEDEKDAQKNMVKDFSNPITLVSKVYNLGYHMGLISILDAQVQKLLKSNQKFDIVISEIFMNEIFLQFADHFNAHAIGFSTVGMSEWTTGLVGNPKEYAYTPQLFLGFTDRMTFLQRLGNTAATLFNEVFYNFIHLPRQEELRKEIFPNGKSLYERLNNVSLLLLNSHTSLTTPKPMCPNVIEIGGFHVGDPAPLPTDLKKLLDDSKQGVIYFSMGTNIQSKDLPDEHRDAILKTFGKRKETVLWKFEADLPNKPKNVVISKWFPQQDILAHPNVKLFITHGGLLSTTEAVARGVPMIGIPVMADQKMNMGNAESLGYGLRVDYDNVTEQSLTWALNSVLNNPKYKHVAKYRSLALNDRVVKPIDEAVFWVEYVIRHNGAYHLRTARNSLNFFQYHLLDLMAVALAVVGIILLVPFLILRLICKKLFGKSPKSTTSKKQKQK